jgi:hypothetical protein
MDVREHENQQPGASRHPWEKARLRVVYRLLQKTPAPSTLLDVGCGDAYVIRSLANRRFGSTFWGVDNALAEGYEIKSQEAQIQVTNSLDALPQGPKGSISHVLLLDVLEHVEDDVGLLHRIQSLPQVASGCIVLITVPAYPALFTEHDRILGHYRRYTAKMLERSVENAGLLRLESGAFFSSLLAPRALEKLIEPFRGQNKKEVTDLSTWSGSEIQTKLVESILYGDYLLAEAGQALGFKLPGLSQYALCSAP